MDCGDNWQGNVVSVGERWKLCGRDGSCYIQILDLDIIQILIVRRVETGTHNGCGVGGGLGGRLPRVHVLHGKNMAGT